MSRSKTISIDRGRFEKAINEVMKTMSLNMYW